jgi:hypothetical protein
MKVPITFWKMGMKPPLCDHNTSCFNKEQHCFYALLYRVFLCQPSYVNLCKLVHEQEQCDTNALRNSQN